jgi:hypothetical protein
MLQVRMSADLTLRQILDRLQVGAGALRQLRNAELLVDAREKAIQGGWQPYRKTVEAYVLLDDTSAVIPSGIYLLQRASTIRTRSMWHLNVNCSTYDHRYLPRCLRTIQGAGAWRDEDKKPVQAPQLFFQGRRDELAALSFVTLCRLLLQKHRVAGFTQMHSSGQAMTALQVTDSRNHRYLSRLLLKSLEQRKCFVCAADASAAGELTCDAHRHPELAALWRTVSSLPDSSFRWSHRYVAASGAEQVREGQGETAAGAHASERVFEISRPSDSHFCYIDFQSPKLTARYRERLRRTNLLS